VIYWDCNPFSISTGSPKRDPSPFRGHMLIINLTTPTITGWWLSPTPEKYEFVSWDHDIPNIWKVIKFMFQTTNQIILNNKYRIYTDQWGCLILCGWDFHGLPYVFNSFSIFSRHLHVYHVCYHNFPCFTISTILFTIHITICLPYIFYEMFTIHFAITFHIWTILFAQKIHIYLLYWLVALTILKNMKVNGKDDIPYCYGK